MRIDKFLKISRIIKRRTIAKQACIQGRVFINDNLAKAGDSVKPGDIIKINFGSNTVKVKVLMIDDNVKKQDSTKLYEYVD